MIVYVLFAVLINNKISFDGGASVAVIQYEFKDKAQCESAAVNFKKHLEISKAYCQEVKK